MLTLYDENLCISNNCLFVISILVVVVVVRYTQRRFEHIICIVNKFERRRTHTHTHTPAGAPGLASPSPASASATHPVHAHALAAGRLSES